METTYSETQYLEAQLQEIHQKLDFITGQMQEYQRKQREMQELKDELVLIGKDAFQTAVTELEEISPHFDANDLVYLLKKLLRNTRNFTQLMDQLENVTDFMNDVKPLGKQMFTELLETLNTLDRKGYFEFLKEAAKIVDTVVTSFSVEDVRLLRENIASILLTVKNVTQPQMLSTMNNAVGFYQKMDIAVQEKVSYREIFRELKDPEVKRGLVFMLEFVKNMANSNGTNLNQNKQINSIKQEA